METERRRRVICESERAGREIKEGRRKGEGKVLTISTGRDAASDMPLLYNIICSLAFTCFVYIVNRVR